MVSPTQSNKKDGIDRFFNFFLKGALTRACCTERGDVT